tara:strand:- start:914 stop:1384 length:471 start_codon:yes stop_codon:yes gene_type:complete
MNDLNYENVPEKLERTFKVLAGVQLLMGAGVLIVVQAFQVEQADLGAAILKIGIALAPIVAATSAVLSRIGYKILLRKYFNQVHKKTIPPSSFKSKFEKLYIARLVLLEVATIFSLVLCLLSGDQNLLAISCFSFSVFILTKPTLVRLNQELQSNA